MCRHVICSGSWRVGLTSRVLPAKQATGGLSLSLSVPQRSMHYSSVFSRQSFTSCKHVLWRHISADKAVRYHPAPASALKLIAYLPSVLYCAAVPVVPSPFEPCSNSIYPRILQ